MPSTSMQQYLQEARTVQRQRMMPTVNQEDYLLARGANPRTGLVTPGVRSANCSIDETGELRDTCTIPNAKWRQKGNAWISLGPDQPTPFEDHAERPMGVYNNECIRTPPTPISLRLHKGRYKGCTPVDGMMDSLIVPRATPTKFPGAFPLTPVGTPLAHRQPSETTFRLRVARKPVAKQALMSVEQQDGRTQRTTDGLASANKFVPLPVANDGLRSSSAPTLWRKETCSPTDIGRCIKDDDSKLLPPLPLQMYPETKHVVLSNVRLRRDEANVGHKRPKLDWVEDIPASVLQQQIQREKVLPDLPVNCNLVPLQRSEKPVASNLTLSRMKPCLKDRSKPCGPRTDLVHPDSRAVPSRCRDQGVKPGSAADWMVGMEVPTYDNPPRNRQPIEITRTSHRVQGPRSMSTTTLLTKDGHAWNIAANCMGTREQSTKMTATSFMGQLRSGSPLEEAARPQMPGRAEAMHRVPRVPRAQHLGSPKHRHVMANPHSGSTIVRSGSGKANQARDQETSTMRGAVEAAKTAMAPRSEVKGTTGPLDAARKAMEACETQDRKEREMQPAAYNVPDDLVRAAAVASISRRAVSLPTRLRISTKDNANPVTRNVSGTSTVNINIPTVEENGFRAAWEMLCVPVRIALMWIHNHPETVAYGWTVSHKLLEMSHVVAETGGRLWRIGYVYSRTGRVRVSGRQNVSWLTYDVLRSLGYFAILCGIASVVLRTVGIVVGLVRVILWCARLAGRLILMVLGVV